MNYDKFNQPNSRNLILSLVEQKVDFVVLDEIHFVKKRAGGRREEGDADNVMTKRRPNLEGLMTHVREKNNNVHVLGMTATPVVNDLKEGKSLLELVTGKVYDDVSDKATVSNAVTLHALFALLSVREMPKYPIQIHAEDVQVQTDIQQMRDYGISIQQLKNSPLLIEQFLLDIKIPEIIRHIEGPTIIYTEYVTSIVKKLRDAV